MVSTGRLRRGGEWELEQLQVCVRLSYVRVWKEARRSGFRIPDTRMVSQSVSWWLVSPPTFDLCYGPPGEFWVSLCLPVYSRMV